MSDGTYLMEVYVPRIHKCNAEQIAEEEEDLLAMYWDELLVLAASPGPRTEEERAEVRSEVRDLREAMVSSWFRAFCASRIKNNPEDCIDELVDDDYDRWHEKTERERREWATRNA